MKRQIISFSLCVFSGPTIMITCDATISFLFFLSNKIKEISFDYYKLEGIKLQKKPFWKSFQLISKPNWVHTYNLRLFDVHYKRSSLYLFHSKCNGFTLISRPNLNDIEKRFDSLFPLVRNTKLYNAFKLNELKIVFLEWE